jgi:hypothetical protein
MTTYLKFTSEADAIAALADYRSDDGWIVASHDHAIDVVGTIHKPTGNMLTDSDGMQYPEMAPLDGFHINLIGNIPEAAKPYVVFPGDPVRVFAS